MSHYTRGEDIYQDVQNQGSQKDKLLLISRLTEQQKKEYKKYQAKLRQAKFRANNTEEANKRSKEVMKKLRTAEPEKYREYDKIQKRKQIAIEKAQIASIASTSAMGSILQSVGQNIFNIEKQKQKEAKNIYMREYMRKRRAQGKK